MLAHKSMFTLCDVNCSCRTEDVFIHCPTHVCFASWSKYIILSKVAFFLLVSFFLLRQKSVLLLRPRFVSLLFVLVLKGYK